MESWKKKFAIIWTGQFFSILSSTVVGYSVIFWLSLETGSAEILSLAAIASLLPQAVAGLFTGVYVDRWDRKKVMIFADSFIALCTLGLAVLFWTGTARIWHLYILLASRSVGSAFHMPAMQASVPLLAPQSQLARIAGVNQMIQSVCGIAGPALGALFIGLFNMGTVLMLDVAGAVLACTSLLFVKIPRPEKESSLPPDVFREVKDGFREIYSKKGLAPLFAFSVGVTFFIMPVSVMFPLMTLDHFSGDAFGMSLVEMLWAGGTLLGGAVMGMRGYKANKVLLINAMYIVIGVCLMLSGLLSSGMFAVFCAFTAVTGVAGAVYNSSFIAVVQSNVDPAVLGRVLSVFFSLSLMPSAIGLLGTGFLAENVGITTTFVLAGVAITAIGLGSFALPSMKSLDSSVR